MILTNMLLNKCPRCNDGLVFENSNLFAYKSVKMYPKCPCCQYGYTKESGFYWGAMYVSYALATLEGVVTFLICKLMGNATFYPINLWLVIITMLIFAPYNYRLSRIVWLYIFS